MSTKKPAAPKSALAGTDTLDRSNTNAKLDSLEKFRSDATDQALRTNHGVKIADNQNTLKVGARKLTLGRGGWLLGTHQAKLLNQSGQSGPPARLSKNPRHGTWEIALLK